MEGVSRTWQRDVTLQWAAVADGLELPHCVASINQRGRVLKENVVY